MAVESFVRFDGPSSRVDLCFRLVGIGICSVDISGGIPAGTWGFSTGAGGCSSCTALRLSLLRLHSPCVDLFNAFELCLSICINLRGQHTRIQRTHRYFHQCGARRGTLCELIDTKKVASRANAVSLDFIRPNLKSSLTIAYFCIWMVHVVTVSQLDLGTVGTGKTFFLREEDHVIR